MKYETKKSEEIEREREREGTIKLVLKNCGERECVFVCLVYGVFHFWMDVGFGNV